MRSDEIRWIVAYSSAASSAKYSATLFVSRPIFLASSKTIFPSGSRSTTPYEAGPGLPRDAPSILATCTPAGTDAWESAKSRALPGGLVLVGRAKIFSSRDGWKWSQEREGQAGHWPRPPQQWVQCNKGCGCTFHSETFRPWWSVGWPESPAASSACRRRCISLREFQPGPGYRVFS